MSQITIQSSNFNGYTGDITFYPYSGGSISYGSQTIPYTIETENFNGEYTIDLTYEGTPVVCGVQVGASPCVYITTDGATTDYSGLYTFIGYGYISYDSRVPDIDVICDETNPISQALYYFNDGFSVYIMGVVDDIVARTTELRITQYTGGFNPECGNTYSGFTSTIVAYPTYNSTHLFPSTGTYSTGLSNPGDYTTYSLQNIPSCIAPSPSPTPTPSITPTLTPTPTITPTPSATPSLDPDAAAYLADVVSAGGTTNPTIESAVNTLYTSLKSNGLYNDLFFFPFVGGTAASHSLFGKRSAGTTYDITWFGGMTHGVSGSTGNGTNGYGETALQRPTYSNRYDLSQGIYVVGDSSADGAYELQSRGTDNNVLITRYIGDGAYVRYNGGFKMGSNTDGTGLYIATLSGSSLGSIAKLFKNTSTTLINTATGDNNYLANDNFIFRGGAGDYSPRTTNFVFYTTYLTDAEASTLSTIINTFQTSLGRNIY